MNEFEKLSKQEKLSLLYKLQDTIKDIQKLSWKSTQIMRKFPLEQAEEFDYPSLFKVYTGIISEINLLKVK